MRFLNGDKFEWTLALIKPDAVMANKATDILDDMGKLWVIADVVMARFDAGILKRFYSDHTGKAFFDDLVSFMSSGPMFAVTLVGPDVIAKWREQMGATDPKKADQNSFRGRYAAMDGVVMHNVVHGSDSLSRAEIEMHLVRRFVFSGFGDGVDYALKQYAGAKWSTKLAGVEYPQGDR